MDRRKEFDQWWRIGGECAIGFIILGIIGFALQADAPFPNDSAAEIKAFSASSWTTNRGLVRSRAVNLQSLSRCARALPTRLLLAHRSLAVTTTYLRRLQGQEDEGWERVAAAIGG